MRDYFLTIFQSRKPAASGNVTIRRDIGRIMIIPIQNINPKLLRACYFDGYERFETIKMEPRVCYDYEFEYYLKSDGGVIIDDKYIQFAAKDLNVKKPGQKICGVAPYECYIFSISLDGKHDVPSDYIFGWPHLASPLYENELLDKLGNKISLQEHPHISSLFHELYITSQKNDPLSAFNVNRLLFDILYWLFKLEFPDGMANQSVNPRVIRAINHIKIFYSDNISVTDIIEKSGLSKAYFNKCFKMYTGATPMALITDLRINKAKNLLCMTNRPISAVSSMCGYFDHIYFAYQFKKSTGLTPSAYRKLNSYQ